MLGFVATFMIKVFCDRCRREIYTYDERAADTIKNEHPGKTICQNCSLEIQLGATLARKDLEEGWQPGTALKRMAKLYDII